MIPGREIKGLAGQSESLGRAKGPTERVTGQGRKQDTVWKKEAGQSESLGRAVDRGDSEENEAAMREIAKTAIKMNKNNERRITGVNLVLNDSGEVEAGTKMVDDLER